MKHRQFFHKLAHDEKQIIALTRNDDMTARIVEMRDGSLKTQVFKGRRFQTAELVTEFECEADAPRNVVDILAALP